MTHLSEKSKVSLTIGGFVAMLVAVISCTASITTKIDSMVNRLDQMNRNCWHIEDQQQFAMDLERVNKIFVPDPRNIVRQRLYTPHEKE